MNYQIREQLTSISDKLPTGMWNLVVLGSALLIGLILRLIITALLKCYKNVSGYSPIKSVLTHLSKPLDYFVPLFMLDVMLPIIMKLNDAYINQINRVIGILLIISFAGLLIRSIRVFEDFVYHYYDLSKEDNLKERKVRTQLQFIRKILIVLIVLISMSVILLSFDSVRKIGAGLLTGVGISGIIIGFAAQKSLGNLLAGFQIAFTQPIRIDDVLVVEGEWGRVEEITLTYVVLNIWDQRRLILPINYFIEKPFQNWTRNTSEILGTVFLYVDHTCPIDAVRAEFSRLLSLTPLWDKRVQVLQVTDAREHTVELRALVSAGNSSKAFDLRCYIREGLIRFIAEKYPQSLPLNRLAVNDNIKRDFQDGKAVQRASQTDNPNSPDQ